MTSPEVNYCQSRAYTYFLHYIHFQFFNQKNSFHLWKKFLGFRSQTNSFLWEEAIENGALTCHLSLLTAVDNIFFYQMAHIRKKNDTRPRHKHLKVVTRMININTVRFSIRSFVPFSFHSSNWRVDNERMQGCGGAEPLSSRVAECPRTRDINPGCNTQTGPASSSSLPARLPGHTGTGEYTGPSIGHASCLAQ